jgi:riboflavin kinase/FMN adenylyltransferase
MRLVPGTDALPGPPDAAAIAIGNFDGVHLGHRALIARARAAGGTTCVLTFDPHPARLLAPAQAPPMITTLARKVELLAEAGVELTVVEPFTPALLATGAERFVEELLVRRLHARTVVVGWDFTYGHKRGGNVTTLAAAGRQQGFAVEIIEAVQLDGGPVSSTRIRRAIRNGEVALAARLLGRPFDVDGEVVHGQGRGRTIGVPTANVASAGELLPAAGVYAVRVRAGDRWHDGVANLGVKPTLTAGQSLTLEAHLFDTSGDLYGQTVRVAFIDRLRDERRFPSVEDLVTQIQADMAAARKVLAHE